MMKRLFCISILFLFFLSGPVSYAEKLREIALPVPSNIQKIRVLVVKPRDEVQVSCLKPYEILDGYGKVIEQGDKLTGVTIKAAAEGMLVGKEVIAGSGIIIRSLDHGVKIGSVGVFGDTVAIKKVGNKVEVVNHIPLDDYLKGVIPFEANPAWSLESLKAQAVASRTYAVFKMIEQINDAYDVSSGVYSQVYAGKKIENPRTNQAVDETTGEILVYKNKVFPGYFHSTCGGRTTGADLVWRVKPIEPLKGVECKFCAKSPHYHWEAVFAPSEIKEKMKQKGGIPVQDVKSIKLGKIDGAGRAHEILVGSAWIEKPVDADAFRIWMGPEKLKSNLITKVVATPEGKFKFKGRGWGHGVGVCQYGMKYLGELGYGYQEILGYYYPGAGIMKATAVDNKEDKGLIELIKDNLEENF